MNDLLDLIRATHDEEHDGAWQWCNRLLCRESQFIAADVASTAEAHATAVDYALSEGTYRADVRHLRAEAEKALRTLADLLGTRIGL